MTSFEADPARPPESAAGGRKFGGGCGIAFLIFVLALIAGGWYLANNWVSIVANMLHEPIVQGVRDSNLREKDKLAIIAQIDRVVAEAAAGKIDNTRLQHILETLAKSRLTEIGITYFVEETYVKPSGLSAEEKELAGRTVRRVAQGLIEKKIDRKKFEATLDSISETKGEEHRRLKEKVTDEELRKFLADLKVLADDAKMPEAPEEIDIAKEVEKAVDEALKEPR